MDSNGQTSMKMMGTPSWGPIRKNHIGLCALCGLRSGEREAPSRSRLVQTSRHGESATPDHARRGAPGTIRGDRTPRRPQLTVSEASRRRTCLSFCIIFSKKLSFSRPKAAEVHARVQAPAGPTVLQGHWLAVLPLGARVHRGLQFLQADQAQQQERGCYHPHHGGHAGGAAESAGGSKFSAGSAGGRVGRIQHHTRIQPHTENTKPETHAGTTTKILLGATMLSPITDRRHRFFRLSLSFTSEFRTVRLELYGICPSPWTDQTFLACTRPRVWLHQCDAPCTGAPPPYVAARLPTRPQLTVSEASRRLPGSLEETIARQEREIERCTGNLWRVGSRFTIGLSNGATTMDVGSDWHGHYAYHGTSAGKSGAIGADTTCIMEPP